MKDLLILLALITLFCGCSMSNSVTGYHYEKPTNRCTSNTY